MATHDALKKVGAIIERPNFYPYMTAQENLELVCKIKGINYAKVQEKLEIVGLYDRKDSKFRTFSLGMKQRLAIASALLNDPEILILDEPTNGLDPQGIHQIRDIIRLIASQGTTILLASHLLDEVEKVCSHVLVLRKGEILYSGKVEGMSSTPRVKGFRFEGAGEAKPAAMAHEAILSADAIVICPSNPWVSVDPILATLTPSLSQKGRGGIVAVSPIIGGETVKGPAAEMYRELDIEPSALAVANHYRGVITHFVMDTVDSQLTESVRGLNMRTLVTNTLMKSHEDRRQLAQAILQFIGSDL